MVEITVAYYLGIDGGGSKTTCAVGDEEIVLASSTAGPSNITRIGEERARESIHQAIRAACDAAKLSPRQISRMCIGAAGAAREDVAATLRKFAAELMHGEIEIVADMAIALEAAFGAGVGVIVIAGTGSIAYGRNSRGQTARAGGWGFAIGDEGSAHWIGRETVSQLFRAVDDKTSHRSASQVAELVSPTLFRELKAVWNADSLLAVARLANSSPDFSALFPAACAAADSGDELAREVLERAAIELVRLAALVIHRLFSEGHPAATPIAMVGGVFRHSKIVHQLFCDQLRITHPMAELNPEIVEPVYGALQIARRLPAAAG